MIRYGCEYFFRFKNFLVLSISLIMRTDGTPMILRFLDEKRLEL